MPPVTLGRVAATGPSGANSDNDWELLAATARGDESAFESLVERHQERLLRLCERLLGDREEARDATQEVFLRAFRHAARAQPRGQFYTWLYRIALNFCFNRLRRRRVVRFFSLERSPMGGEERGSIDSADERPDAEEEILARERWRRTRRLLDTLPENQRAVLLLARFEGLSQREIAETLGITEGAVESRLVRAMRRLNRFRAQEFDSPTVAEEEP